MATQIGDCRLCQDKSVELQHSHIIPEFCYKPIYTKKHKLKAFSIHPNCDLEMEQKGYREYILCSDCEQRLAKWENALRWFITDINKNDKRKINISNIKGFTFASHFDYDLIKRAILSIVWRLSVSSRNAFKEYNLGPYEDKLRDKLYSDNYIKSSDYPIVIAKVMINEKFFSDIIALHGKSRYTGQFRMQTLTLNGYVIDTLITEDKIIPKEFSLFSMKNYPLNTSSGQIIMPQRNIQDREFNFSDYSKRFKQPDVQEFFKKYD